MGRRKDRLTWNEGTLTVAERHCSLLRLSFGWALPRMALCFAGLVERLPLAR